MAARQAPPSMGFSRQEYWSGLPLPSPESITPSRFKIEIGKLIFKCTWECKGPTISKGISKKINKVGRSIFLTLRLTTKKATVFDRQIGQWNRIEFYTCKLI